MKAVKKIISVLLCLIMVCSVVPFFGSKTEAANGFVPRTTVPETSNACYYNYSCNPFYTSGLWTWCTWYAYGRAYEILGHKPDLSIGAASQWYYDNISKVNNGGGYAYSSNYYAAKLGAVACYENHVQIVEAVNSDGSPLYLSTGGYTGSKGNYFNNKDGWTQHTMFFYGNDTTSGFLGYIYLGDFSTFANMGEDFYATFLNKAAWKPISVKRGNGVTIETEDGKSTQKWRFTRQSDGAYVIRSCYNGKCLEMTDGIRENCVQVTAQNDFWGGNYQQWYIIPYGSDNSYIIQNKHYYEENWVLDLSDVDPSDGNDIIIYQRNNSDAQIWSIYSADDVQIKPTTLTATVNSPDVTFTWNEVFGESSYDVKIWKGEVWDGDPYQIIWNTESGCTVELPAGTYSAYVDACDYFQCLMSNVVTFTVEETEETEKASGYYTYTVDDEGNATIIKCDPSISGEITVPQTLGGYPVTKIGSNAFNGCKNITEITVLENVTYIDVNAFANCTALKYANIMAQESTLTNIMTFAYCSSLENVYLHNVNSVGAGKFYENFIGCDKLKNVEFAEDNLYLKTVDGVVYSKDGGTLWYVPNGLQDKTYYVPETVTEIAGAAFCDCVNIEDIYIYGSETVINERFYTVNMGYKTVSFNTKHGGTYEKLDYVTIHAKSDSFAKEYADKYGINFVELTDKPTTDLSLFTYEISNAEVTIISCASVEDGDGYVEIPSEIEGYPVTTLAEYSFFNSLGVRKLTIPNTVKTIGDGAFACDFESFVIPESVTNIGDHVFINCNYLKTITVDKNNPCYSSDEYGTLFNKDMTELICHPSKNSRTDYVVADSVVKIAEYAFWNSNIEYLSINKNVTDIGDYAFGLCESLKNIVVDEENPNYSSDDCGVLFNKDKTVLINYPVGNERESYAMPETVTEIKMCAFEWAVNLENIVFSDKLKTIGHSAFYCCNSLKTVNIPDGVTMLDESMFYFCSSLEEVILPQSLKFIKNDAFTGCISLKEIDLPDGLTELGAGAFSDCTALEKVYIPCSVKKIQYNAFVNCVNLEYVHIPDTVEEIGENILEETEGAYICSYTDDCYAKEYAEEYGYEFRVCDNHGLVDPDAPDEPDVPDVPDEPGDNTEKNYRISIRVPSTTTIRYGDSIILRADVSEIPQGSYVVWEASNGNFDMRVSADGSTCTITPKSSGDTTFTAKVVSSDGEVLAEDTQTMTSKAGLWDKIVAFFKKIFGLTKTIPQIYRGVF